MKTNLKKQIEIVFPENIDNEILEKIKNTLGEEIEILSSVDKSRFKKQIQIRAANELSEETLQAIKNKFSPNEEVDLDIQIDQSLIGGIMIKFGDKVYDNTLRSKLNYLKQKLK